MENNCKTYPEDASITGVRYRYNHVEPYGYYDERIHGGEPEMRNYRRYSDGRFAPKSSMEYPSMTSTPIMRTRCALLAFVTMMLTWGYFLCGDKTHGSERTMGYALQYAHRTY